MASRRADPAVTYARSVVGKRRTAGPYVHAACARFLSDLERDDIWYDREAADRISGFFRDVLVLKDGQFDGRPFALDAFQEFILRNLFGWKRCAKEDDPDDRSTWRRRFRRAYIEIGKGNGKALSVDTPIPTPDGWRVMGALRPGDRVFDERGKPTEIVAVSEEWLSERCYEVEMDCGDVIVADADHLWRTEARKSYLPTHGESVRTDWRHAVRTTREIAETWEGVVAGTANHSIPVAPALEYPRRGLATGHRVSPYVLGVWLGDGDSDAGRITQHARDWQVIEECEREGAAVGSVAPQKGKPSVLRVRLEGLHVALRAEGLLGAKRIPDGYMTAPTADRLALLQGLLDTDGYIPAPRRKGTPRVELCLSNRPLAEQALELVRSLGMKATCRPRRVTIPALGYEGQAWRVTFNPGAMPVFRLRRKRDRQRGLSVSGHRAISRDHRIVRCEARAGARVKCIQVAAESGMFLAGRAMIPTHNSPMLAGIGLYCLLADGEAGAQVYAAAATKDQAKVVFDDAVHMARARDLFGGRLVLSGRNPVWQITHPEKNGKFIPLSKDTGRTGSGLRPSCALIDELHEHPNRDILDMLERGFKFRRQPFLIMATNSGTDRNSVCYQEHDHARRVATRMVEDDDTFSFICGLGESDDPIKNRKCWVKANPLLDKVITRDLLSRAVKQARDIPAARNRIMRLHFCVWTDAEAAWINHHVWMACEDETLDEERYYGRKYWAGLDLSATTDLTAYVRFYEDGFDDHGRRKYAVFTRAYMPADKLHERAREDRVPYELWVERGDLTLCPGSRIRYDQVAEDVIRDAERGGLECMAYDKWLYNLFKDALMERGAYLPEAEHPQGYLKRRDSELWMPGSIDEFETMIREKRLRIKPSHAMRSAVASATFLETPVGLRKFAKNKATARIDCAVAAAMAAGAAAAGPVNKLAAYYETERAITGSA